MNIKNFLHATTTWTNSELALIKICIAAAYLIIGAYFSTFVTGYLPFLCILFIITAVHGGYLWIKKMKANNT